SHGPSAQRLQPGFAAQSAEDIPDDAELSRDFRGVAAGRIFAVSTAGTEVSLARELAAVVGEEHVREDPATLAGLSLDDLRPAGAGAPGTVAEVAAIVSFASKHGLVVVPAGGFTRQGIGSVPERVDIVLETRRFNALEHYDAGDLTLGAGAGMTLAA